MRRKLSGANVSLIIKNIRGEHVAAIASWDQDFKLFLDPGRHVVTIRLNDLILTPGDYLINIEIDPTINDWCDAIFDYPFISVINEGQVTHWLGRPWGILHCQEVEWNSFPCEITTMQAV